MTRNKRTTVDLRHGRPKRSATFQSNRLDALTIRPTDYNERKVSICSCKLKPLLSEDLQGCVDSSVGASWTRLEEAWRFSHPGADIADGVAGAGASAADFWATCRLITDQISCIRSYRLFSGSNPFRPSCNRQYFVSSPTYSTSVPTSDIPRIVSHFEPHMVSLPRPVTTNTLMCTQK